MLIYALATAASMAFASAASYVARKEGPRNNWITGKGVFAFLSFLPLALVAAFRDEVGTDWPIYSTFFADINEGTRAFDEWGFNLLNRVVYAFSHSYSAMAAVVALLTCAFAFKAIYDQSENYAVSILIFVVASQYFTLLNQQRQMLALAIFLYAFQFVRKRKFLPYLCWCVVAYLFHSSAIFLVPLYFLYGARLRPPTQILLALVNVVASYPLSKFIVWVVAKTSYGSYLGSYYDQNDFYLLGYLYSTAVLLILYFFYYVGEDRDNKDYNMLLSMNWIVILLLLYSASIPQVSRVVIYLSATLTLDGPSMFLREKRPARRTIYMVLVILVFVAKLLYDVYVNKWYGVLPYHSIFS